MPHSLAIYLLFSTKSCICQQNIRQNISMFWSILIIYLQFLYIHLLRHLVDNSSDNKLLSFMDSYSGYNQISMTEDNEIKTVFMTESGNYYYKVMPFELRNAGATYQRMMKKCTTKIVWATFLRFTWTILLLNPNTRSIIPPISNECLNKPENTTWG